VDQDAQYALLIFGTIVSAYAAVHTYNLFVRYQNLIEESWSGIDVALKRRANLLPNLVAVVKAYARHEAGTLNEVTALRTGAANPHQRLDEESRISKSLQELLVVAEAYPDLKASRNFLDLQNNLDEIEKDIQQARMRYNGAVRRLNTLLQQFPSNLIGRLFRFHPAEYFSLELATQREVPAVEV
jgi:LemA protein